MSACPECGRDCTCYPAPTRGIQTYWAWASGGEGSCNFCNRQFDRELMRIDPDAKVLVMRSNGNNSIMVRICPDCIMEGIGPHVLPHAQKVHCTLPAKRFDRSFFQSKGTTRRAKATK